MAGRMNAGGPSLGRFQAGYEEVEHVEQRWTSSTC